MSKVEYIILTELVDSIIDNRGKTVPTVENGIPLIATNCIKEDSIYPTFDKVRFISDEIYDTWFRAHLIPNDILFVNKGTPGRACLVPDPVNFVAAQDMVGLRFKKKYDPYYMLAVIRSKEVKKNISNNHVGLVIPHYRKQELLNLKLPILEKSLRNFIGKTYKSISLKIEINNKINQELEAMAKTLYDYWFVQFDFPTSEAQAKQIGNLSLVGKPYKSSGGKMVFNKELKREIPEGWEVMMLSGFSDCNKWNRTKESIYDKINYLDTSSLTENVIESIQELDFERDKIPSRAQRIVSENDILYSTVRPNQLHYGIIKRPIENLIASTGFAQIRSNNSKITNDFIYQILSQDYVSTRLQQIAVGSVSAYPSISHNDIMDLKIALPLDEKLIKKGTEIFQQCNEKVALNLEENQKLSELRDWLLPMLMNGQATVGSPVEKRDIGEVEQELGMVAEDSAKYGKV